MKKEIMHLTEKCEEVKIKYSEKSFKDNTDNPLSYLETFPLNSDLSLYFIENDFKELQNISEKLVLEYDGDKSELKKETEKVLSSYLESITLLILGL